MSATASGACPACGAPMERWREATASDPRLAARASYRLLRCPRCATAATAGAGEEAPERLYAEGAYAAIPGGANAVIEPLRRLSDRDRMRFVRALPRGATVVEVGAGDGRFVSRMRVAGLDARGYEPSAEFVRRAREAAIPVEEASIETANVAPESTDCVVAWHVLEHLPDPSGSVSTMTRWLRPGGLLVLACPNLDSWAARLGGDAWFNQDVPRHLTHFTASGLCRLLAGQDLEVKRVAHWVVEQNPLGMWQTLLNRLTRERDVAFRLLKRNFTAANRPPVADVAVTVAAGALLIPVAIVLELAAALFGHGGSVAIVAARRTR